MLLLIYSIGSKILRSNSTVLTQLITKRPKFYMVNNNNKKAKHNISREKNATKTILNIFLRKKTCLDYHMKLIYFLKWTQMRCYNVCLRLWCNFSRVPLFFTHFIYISFQPLPQKNFALYIYPCAVTFHPWQQLQHWKN